jgi:uncharacterized repeat protein (TIGR03803 family)
MKNIFRIAILLVFPLLSVLGFSQTVREVLGFTGNLSSYGGGMTPVQGRDGKLYGSTTGFGLATTGGSVVRITMGGKASAVYTFSQVNTFPSGLVLATDGSFYGVLGTEGSFSSGVLFKVTSAGTYTALYNFTGGSDGRYPTAPPIQASDGNLYGTTENGTVDDGTVYKFVPSTGTFTTIFSFSQDGLQGSGIVSPPVQATDGNLYGVAQQGGANGCGTIFTLATSGTLLRVYSFPCGAGGNIPLGPLIQASDGNLYGATQWGGNMTARGDCHSGCGTVFRMSHGVVTILYSFSGSPNDGAFPTSGLLEGTDGNLYGGTYQGGTNGFGTLYQIATSSQYKVLYNFAYRIGSGATAALMQNTNGKFYGNTSFGGRNGEGAIYSLDMGLVPFIALVRYTGGIGQPVQILGQGLTGSTAVTVNGMAATSFKVVSDTYMTAVVPTGVTTGPVVVSTPTGTLTSNHNFQIVQ